MTGSGSQIDRSPIADLSGGERKKVFLSAALVKKDAVLLMDEPTNSLDLQSRTLLHRELRQHPGGAVIITHDTIFDDLADAIFVIDKGGHFCETEKGKSV